MTSMYRIAQFSLTTGAADRLADFYERALGFRQVGIELRVGAAFETSMGIAGGARGLVLELGEQEVVLREFFLLEVRGGSAVAANAARWLTTCFSDWEGEVRFNGAALASLAESIIRVSGRRVAACPSEEMVRKVRGLLGNPWSISAPLGLMVSLKLA